MAIRSYVPGGHCAFHPQLDKKPIQNVIKIILQFNSSREFSMSIPEGYDLLTYSFYKILNMIY